MADCLTLLRQYNLQKKEIVERDGLIIFDQIAWTRNAKTNYLTYRYVNRGLWGSREANKLPPGPVREGAPKSTTLWNPSSSS